MEAKTVSSQTQNVQRRFFEAIDILVLQGKLAGLQTFCIEHDLHKAKYSTLRSSLTKPNYEARYKLIDIDAIVHLVKDYGVSSDWILLGRGLMFKQ